MSSKSLYIKDTFLNAVHFLPNGTQWTGDVHYYSEDNPSPDGFVGFMTGKNYSQNGIELVSFPTLIEYPGGHTPGSSDILNLVFSDLQASGIVGESEIKNIEAGLRTLGNTITMARSSIDSAVSQIIGAVNNSVNQTEEDGAGIIEDNFFEDVITLETSGVTDYRNFVNTIEFTNTGTSLNGPLIFHGDAETLEENLDQWKAMLNDHITVDMLSRVNTLTIDEIIDQMEEDIDLEVPHQDFRVVSSDLEEGFTGCLKVTFTQPVKLTHLKLLFATFIDIVAIKANDDAFDLVPLSFNVYTFNGGVNVTDINIYFTYLNTSPFKSQVDLKNQGGTITIVDMIGLLFPELGGPTVENIEQAEEETLQDEGGQY